MRKQPNSRNCFICGVVNGAGVRVAFWNATADDGSAEVEARFTPRDEHQGYPGRLHGGIIAGVLDETIGRAINAGQGDGDATVWGVAAELRVRYRRPVPLNVELVARGRLRLRRSRLFEGDGELVLPDGTVAATARGKYVAMPLEAITAGDPEELGWRVYPDDELASGREEGQV